MQPTVNQTLKDIYYDPSHPASFSTAKKLHGAASEKVPDIKLKAVEEWLRQEVTYTLHKPSRKRFKRNPILVQDIDEQWEADLVDLQDFSRENKGNKYLITIIDSLSKYAWAIPIKTKTAAEVSAAFSKLFAVRRPEVLRTDKGKEFMNSRMKELLDGYNIRYYVSRNEDIKCSIVERFNRTLKARMFKYFTSKGTRKYIDVIDKIVKAYNRSS